jgi:hypothetical protein
MPKGRITIDLWNTEDEWREREPRYGGPYKLDKVYKDNGQLRLWLSYCGNEDQKRLRDASLVLDHQAVGELAVALARHLSWLASRKSPQ